MTRNIQIPAWVALAVATIVVAVGGLAIGASLIGHQGRSGMMNGGTGTGMMSRAYTTGGTATAGFGGMMGGDFTGMMGGANWNASLQPGAVGFVAGTTASPRVIRILAGPGYTFTPSTITIQRGETVTFIVTSMGPVVHEFMVGPADAVAADQSGTPEVADIGLMQTKSLTYTFDGTGPYAYACHADGHYEAGMRGTISLVG